MEIDLTGKRAFVSGSTPGIGRVIAARLAGAGARTTINGRPGAGRGGRGGAAPRAARGEWVSVATERRDECVGLAREALGYVAAG